MPGYLVVLGVLAIAPVVTTFVSFAVGGWTWPIITVVLVVIWGAMSLLLTDWRKHSRESSRMNDQSHTADGADRRAE
jgi:membrane protein implicated in regulation of membrane protease activity